jgi:hypothetical protein
MNQMVKAVPRAGLIVRDPDDDFKPLPPDGKPVPRNVHWVRQERAGDVRFESANAAPVKPATKGKE